MTRSIIVANNLTKTFKTRDGMMTAVDDVSFSAEPGQLFGLFGTNGAGKSTIVGMLTTLLQPSSGTATVCGYDVVQESLAVRASIGLVATHEQSFYGRLTVWQNLTYFAALQNIPRRMVAQRVRYVLDLFGLTAKTTAIFQSLSTGQKQRLNMARALIHDPAILFLDEPTKSMDVQTSDFVKLLIKDELVGNQGKTIVFISHELYEMDNFCDQVVILSDGKVRATGSPTELATQLPRTTVFRVVVEGPAEQIVQAWQQLPRVINVDELSQGVMLTTLAVTLAHEDGWWQLLAAVQAAGGRVESYTRVDDSSLRHIVKHFSGTAPR